ncbi:hypothetical protein MC885_004393, partial [Smutsia gigantea]
AFMQPHLLGNEFTHLEFPRRVQRKELGKKMLYRDFNMTGWAYKTIEEDDLKFPLIYGEGKKARVMATIGVTRGLGDHDLKVHDSSIYIKPFLSSAPEVRIYDISKYEHGTDDVLVLATDGLWDVLSNEEVAEAITQFLPNCDPDDPHRYTLAAQDLVMRARGVLKDRGWRMSNDRLGSGDDISARQLFSSVTGRRLQPARRPGPPRGEGLHWGSCVRVSARLPARPEMYFRKCCLCVSYSLRALVE